ncbi:hypothetical protein, partial [Pseudoalteromonas sp. T1lg88]|uniref:hypothetical protein n=1 Tax=Pseudoalteromonas sp. T1lg88 TaxID=2077104 RepID=UPI0018FEB5B4
GDYLRGEAGNDTYLFAKGDGNTTIDNYDTVAGSHDVLQFMEGIVPEEVQVGRSSNNLLLQIGNEVITVANFFINDGVSVYALDG